LVWAHERGLLQGYLGIWYLYIQQLVQLLMLVNSALNLPIYLCVRQANQLHQANKPVLILRTWMREGGKALKRERIGPWNKWNFTLFGRETAAETFL
jgi:hypothetical protein